MEEKICGLLGGKLKKNIVAELHGLFGGNGLKHFDVDANTLSDILKNEKFDALYVDTSLRLRVMPLMSKTSPEARLGGGVDLILRMPNGKLYGHNTEIYGFSYLLDRAGLDVSSKKCMILGNGLDAAAVYNVLKMRHADSIILMTRDKYANICDYTDTEIVIVTSRAEAVSLDGFEKLEAVIDIRTDRVNSDFAENDRIASVNGYAMAASSVKLASQLITGAEISENELLSAISKIEKMRTSIILAGTELTELGKAVADIMGRKFYDLNATIELLNGKSIEQIKKENGASELCRMKRVAVDWAAKQIGAVITVGDDLDDLSKLKRNGVVVSFPNGLDTDADIATAVENIVRSFEK